MFRGTVFLLIWIGFSSVATGEVRYQKEHATDFCKERWTKRGQLDQGMFTYCMKQQAEGFQELRDLLRKVHRGERGVEIPNLQAVLKYAIEKWAKPHDYQMNMVAYAVKKEIDGYLDVEWDMSKAKYSPSALQRCKNKWLPQWSMVHYCLKK